MKKIIIIYVIFIVLVGCKTSKGNYKKKIENGIEYIENLKQDFSKKELKQEILYQEEENGDVFFSNLIAISLDDKGNIYILDQPECKIHKFNSKGKYLKSFGSKGEGPGELNNPLSLKIYKNKLFVHDGGNFRLSEFDLDGNFITNKKITDISIESFEIDDFGNFYVHNSFFVFSSDKDKFPLFKIFDKNFDFVKDIGERLITGNPSESMLKSQVVLDFNNNNDMVTAKYIDKEITIYQNKKVKTIITRPLFIKVEEPIVKFSETEVLFDWTEITRAIFCDRNDNIYTLTCYDEKLYPVKTNKLTKILEKYDSDGILQEIYPLYDLNVHHLTYNPIDNSIIFIDFSNEEYSIRKIFLD